MIDDVEVPKESITDDQWRSNIPLSYEHVLRKWKDRGAGLMAHNLADIQYGQIVEEIAEWRKKVYHPLVGPYWLA